MIEEDKMGIYDKGILSEKVADDIRQMIMEKNLSPGDKLPNEIEMSELINVSRSTVREAIKILVSTNVLEVKRGRGTFVTSNPGVSNDPLGLYFMEEDNLLLHFFEMRLILEPQMIRLAAIRGTDEDLHRIEKAYEEVCEKIKTGKNHTGADIRFHNSIAEATHNPIMNRIIPIINNGIKGGYAKTKDNPEMSEVVLADHKKIMEALLERDPDKAFQAMEHHIHYGMERCKLHYSL
jgi:DNA-binding FadR family transcriptional regulator